MAPPWVVRPGTLPADAVWRQSGEVWLNDVWRPFWDSLTPQEQACYLALWPPPREWWEFYLDPAFQAWLRSDDSL